MGLPTEGYGVDVVEARRVFIAGDEIGLVTGQRTAAYQEVVIRGRGQRLCQQDAALQVIDVIVDARRQVDDSGHDARSLVAHLDAQALGTDEQVLVFQEVQRTAGTAELLAAADRARLGCKAVDCQALVAELGRPLGLIVRIHAIQAAIHARQLVVHVGNLEVAPLTVIVVIGNAHEELAHCRREFLHRAVITEGRIVVIRIDAAEQRVR